VFNNEKVEFSDCSGIVIFEKYPAILSSIDEVRFLTIKSTYQANWNNNSDEFGLWDLPKGKVKQGEDLKNSAIRETLEETGFLPDKDYIMLSKNIIKDNKLTLYSAVIIDPYKKPIFLENPDFGDIEHNDYTWVTFDEFCENGFSIPTLRNAISKIKNVIYLNYFKENE
jgi:8-oxo-dGTP pyrophosphatase MutT (NUDIX family)